MEGVKEKAAVKRVLAALHEHGLEGEIHVLSDSARTAQEAATALGIEVGQIASSLIFKLPDESPLLIITSGRHRVDTDLVAKNLGIEKLGRVDADYVTEKSGFSIGGVPLMGNKPRLLRLLKSWKSHCPNVLFLPKFVNLSYGGV